MKRTLKPIFPPAAIEKEYRKRLLRKVEEMKKSCVYWLRARYRANESKILDSATDDLQREFRKLLRQWERNFRDFSKPAADWFAKANRDYAARNLKEQFRGLQNLGLGFDLKFQYMSQKERQIFNAIVTENVNLIKSIASECLTQVEGIVMRSIENGYDLGTMTENLYHQFGVTERRAAMIARDQTNKATNNLSRQRLMDYGVKKGVWMHTAAGKTYRESHVEMDGTEYDIAEGCFDEHEGRNIQPAELVNCRCVCRPIIPGMEETKAGIEEISKEVGDPLPETPKEGKEGVSETTSKENNEETLWQQYDANSRKINTTLADIETQRRTLTHEVGTIIDLQGNVINVTGGGAHSVSPPVELLKDAIFTHNHPSGGCFSAQDIFSMIKDDVLELRASTPQGTYFSLMRKEGSAINGTICGEYKNASSYSRAADAISKDLAAGKIKRSDVTWDLYVKYMSKAGEKWLEENADDYGFVFRKGKIGK